MIQNFFSENWEQATEKFYKNASNAGELLWCVDSQHKFDIPYSIVGNGPNVVLMISGVNGIQGFYGSAAQNLFLKELAPYFKPEILRRFTFVLVHVVNGWGMQNKMPETLDKQSGALIDINRNIGVDFSKKKKIPKNPIYNRAHNLLVSKPEPQKKLAAIKKNSRQLMAKRENLFRGQHAHKNGLFFGGVQPARESLMTRHILDNVMSGARSLTAINFTTGPCMMPQEVTCDVYSHGDFKKIDYFANLMGGFSVSGVDEVVRHDALPRFLKSQYGNKMPVYSANWCLGTYKNPGTFSDYLLLHAGNARWETENYGKISPYTHGKLIGLWYMDNPLWKDCAMVNTYGMFDAFLHRINHFYGKNR